VHCVYSNRQNARGSRTSPTTNNNNNKQKRKRKTTRKTILILYLFDIRRTIDKSVASKILLYFVFFALQSIPPRHDCGIYYVQYIRVKSNNTAAAIRTKIFIFRFNHFVPCNTPKHDIENTPKIRYCTVWR